ncbi:hypothetical protein PMIN01_02319 [Paraphaeosphaeria minitans]|uniref:Uncharacterized protein n=1 Tax=Paraphaeosphaeria minitans TaxID=565426 RepID=A0A9P6GSE6_9PLEO|nr:hypothetical protein PMIN01_02319 [Paraphaeosphaeria minitans]
MGSDKDSSVKCRSTFGSSGIRRIGALGARHLRLEEAGRCYFQQAGATFQQAGATFQQAGATFQQAGATFQQAGAF